MTMHNRTGNEMAAIVGVIDPDVTTAGTQYSDYVDASKFGMIMGIGLVGTIQATGTMDYSLVQATDASGTGVKAITGAAATQLTAAGTDSDKQVVITLDPANLDHANSFTFVALKQVNAVADADAGGLLIGLAPRNAPASDNDVASVDEIVNA